MASAAQPLAAPPYETVVGDVAPLFDAEVADTAVADMDECIDMTAAAAPAAPPQATHASRAEKIEPPARPDAPLAVRPQAAPQPSGPLPSSWASSRKSQREMPKAAKIAAAGVASLLFCIFALPGACGASGETRSSSMITDNAAPEADSLKKRRHLSDEDFRVPGAALPQPAEAQAPGVSLEDRQRLREQNPEDLRSAGRNRHGRPHTASHRSTTQPTQPEDAQDMLVFFEAPSQLRSAKGKSESAGALLLAAASTVRIALTNDVVIRSGRTTVVARVDSGSPLLRGAKLIGSATADRDGIVAIQFRTLVLPDGRSLNVRAEALDRATGSFDLVASVMGGVSESDEPGVLRSVGADATERAALSALGGGFVGSTARQTVSEGTRRRSPRRAAPVVVTLSSQTALDALFLEEVSEPRDR